MQRAKTLKPKELALTAVMTAVTAVVTMITGSFVPFPATGGYLNLGDAMVMLSGLLFGGSLGGFAGGVGSALSDIFLGYPYFAPLTLIIKGVEGYLTGLIGNSKRLALRVAGVVAGACAMLVGYFSVETPLSGMGAAFGELIAINSIQVAVGAIASLVLVQVILRTYPDIETYKPQPARLRSGLIMILVAIVVLALIVGVYLRIGISP
jgi:uncharacterized membrane protein